VTVLADDDVVMHGDSERLAISTIALVIWISACDGVGSPEGAVQENAVRKIALMSFSFFDAAGRQGTWIGGCI
jgi:hypothetical protein